MFTKPTVQTQVLQSCKQKRNVLEEINARQSYILWEPTPPHLLEHISPVNEAAADPHSR